VNPVRRSLAWGLFAAGAALFLLTLGASLLGGATWGSVSLHSWKTLRWSLGCGAAAWALHPAREAWIARARALVARHPRAWLWGAWAGLAAYLVGYKVTQFYAFDVGAFDLSLFEHALYNTLHGRFMFAFGLNRNLFSQHFEPVFLLALPLYALWSSGLMLQAMAGLGAAAAAIPLYRLARGLGCPALVAVLVVALFFASAFFWRALPLDCHPELWTPVAAFSACAAAAHRRWAVYYAALVGLLLIKEEMALVAVCLAGFTWAAQRRAWPHAVATVALGVAWGAAAFAWIIPAAHPSAPAMHPLAGRWAALGQSAPEMAAYLLTHPAFVLERLVSAPMAALLGSVGGLALLDPGLLVLSLPPALAHRLGDYEAAASLRLYYGLPSLTLLMLAAVRGIARWGPRAGWGAAALALALAIAAQPGPRFWHGLGPNEAAGQAVLQRLAQAPHVCAQSMLVPHLAPGAGPSMIPDCDPATDRVLLGLQRDTWPLDEAQYWAYVHRVLAAADFGVESYQGDFLVLRRGADPGPNASIWAGIQKDYAPRLR